MVELCAEMEAPGTDACRMPVVRQRAWKRGILMADKGAAVSVGCANLLERACDEVQASRVGAPRLPEVRLAMPVMDKAAIASCADQMEGACDKMEASGADAHRLPEVRLQAWRKRSASGFLEASVNEDPTERAEASGAINAFRLPAVPEVRRQARRKLSAAAALDAAVNAGRPDQMERACDKVEATGTNIDFFCLPEVRRQARRMRSVLAELDNAVNSGCADQMEQVCHEVEASGADTRRLPEVRRQAQRIRSALAALDEAVNAGCANHMERACDEVEASGADDRRLPEVRRQARAMRALDEAVNAGCANQMERACDEVEASGADARRLPEVRRQAQRIRSAMAVLDEAVASLEAAARLLPKALASATSSNADNIELVATEVIAISNKFNHAPQTCKCVVCSTSTFQDRAALCSRGLHALCSSCFEAYARAEHQQHESVIYERCARLLCPCRLPHDAECTGWFREQSMAAFLPVELYEIHMDQQRQQIHAEESAKFNNMLSQMAKQLQRDMPGISHELLQRQLKAALPGARQCGGCGYGPVEHYACGDLQSHHNESRGSAKINNACPKCGWFRANVSQWPKWDGILHPAVTAQSPSTKKQVHHAGPSARRHVADTGGGAGAAGSTEDSVATELQAREDDRLSQIRADHAFALRLSRQIG